MGEAVALAIPRLILLGGVAANERLFARQMERFPDLIVPRWIPNMPRESLVAYARRLAATMTLNEECIVGGASFGAMIALEMAGVLRSKACIIISSVRSPKEFPPLFRCLRPAATLGPDAMGVLAGYTAQHSGGVIGTRVRSELHRFSEPAAEFRRWAGTAALGWRPTYDSRLVIHQIHGSADATFPLRYTHADVVVKGAGHVLPVSHPDAVNAFLEYVLKRHS